MYELNAVRCFYRPFGPRNAKMAERPVDGQLISHVWGL